MSVWINFDYLSTGSKISEDEASLIQHKAGVSPEVAARIVRAAAMLRSDYKKGEIPYAPSVGDLVNWAILVADGLDIMRAADETIISMTSDDLSVQEIVRQIIARSARQEQPGYESVAKAAA
jgi:nitric oxide reductase NorQ protein